MFRKLLNRKRRADLSVTPNYASKWLDAETAALVARTAQALDNARKAV